MKVETFTQQNRIVIHTKDGWAVLVSYQTPVAARSPEGKLYKTNRKWSPTTSRHTTRWVNATRAWLFATRGVDEPAQIRGQEFFDTLLHAR